MSDKTVGKVRSDGFPAGCPKCGADSVDLFMGKCGACGYLLSSIGDPMPLPSLPDEMFSCERFMLLCNELLEIGKENMRLRGVESAKVQKLEREVEVLKGQVEHWKKKYQNKIFAND